MSLQPLPKEVTDEIRFILVGCQSGRLKHFQGWYHCGTAHCIAGWKSVLDYAKAKKDESLLTADFDADDSFEQKLETFEHPVRRRNGSRVYATAMWGLTDYEATQLIAASATFDSQFQFLERLEAGERFQEQS